LVRARAHGKRSHTFYRIKELEQAQKKKPGISA
jgi:hypothetical protein